MPRKSRQFVPGVAYHLTVRGNNGIDTFHKDADRLCFLQCMEHASIKFDLTIHAYVLMSNHVHLLATGANGDSASGFFRSMGANYVRYFNETHRRTGTLWGRRYWSSMVQTDDYLLNCMRYIEMNPVRAGMVDSPESYFWSSHGHNARGSVHPLLKPHPTYLGLGETPERRRHAYRQVFQPNEAHAALDERFRQAIRRGWAVGDDEFMRWADSLSVVA